MKAATLIVGGVFSYIGITFLLALEASSATPAPDAYTVPTAETARPELVSTSRAEIWNQCITQN